MFLEGTSMVVLQFPRPWPVSTPRLLVEKRDDRGGLRLTALPDGSVDFAAHSGGHIAAEFRTVPLSITGGGFVLVTTIWTAGGTRLFLSGREIPAHGTELTEVVVIETKDVPPSTTPSFADPEAPAACVAWMDWRKHRYLTPKKQPKKNRQLKTMEDQLTELDRAATALKHLSALIAQGQGFFTGHLAAELRALTYWNGSTYNPLLLRLAGRLSLPLPVYFLRRDPPPPHVTLPAFHLRRNEPSLVQFLPKHILGDLQEWLSGEVLTLQLPAEQDSTEVRYERLTAKELILAAATTLGAAHYDEDVPDTLLAVFQTRGPVWDEVTHFLLITAYLVSGLSEYVLSIARGSGGSSAVSPDTG